MRDAKYGSSRELIFCLRVPRRGGLQYTRCAHSPPFCKGRLMAVYVSIICQRFIHNIYLPNTLRIPPSPPVYHVLAARRDTTPSFATRPVESICCRYAIVLRHLNADTSQRVLCSRGVSR